MRYAVYVAERNPVAAANGAGAEGHSVDEYVAAAVNMNALIAVGGTADSASEDGNVLLVLYGERAFNVRTGGR